MPENDFTCILVLCLCRGICYDIKRLRGRIINYYHKSDIIVMNLTLVKWDWMWWYGQANEVIKLSKILSGNKIRYSTCRYTSDTSDDEMGWIDDVRIRDVRFSQIHFHNPEDCYRHLIFKVSALGSDFVLNRRNGEIKNWIWGIVMR